MSKQETTPAKAIVMTPTRWILVILSTLGFLLAALILIGVIYYAATFAYQTVEGPEGDGTHIIIGLDISDGNPLVSDAGFADRAGERLRKLVSSLAIRSRVSIRSFGDYGESPASLQQDRDISANASPGQVGDLVNQIVEKMPEIMAGGKIQPHTDSNIVAFLEGIAGAVDCSRDTRLILVTDGLEDSEYVTITDDTGALPNPLGPIYEGCTQLQMVGLGRGQNSPVLTRHLQAQWQNWARQAGFKDFLGLVNW